MNKPLFDEEIEKSGLRPGFIVDKLGISPQAYSKKRNGIVPFTLKEAKILRELFNWSDSKVCKIFLD